MKLSRWKIISLESVEVMTMMFDVRKNVQVWNYFKNYNLGINKIMTFCCILVRKITSSNKSNSKNIWENWRSQKEYVDNKIMVCEIQKKSNNSTSYTVRYFSFCLILWSCINYKSYVKTQENSTSDKIPQNKYHSITAPSTTLRRNCRTLRPLG